MKKTPGKSAIYICAAIMAASLFFDLYAASRFIYRDKLGREVTVEAPVKRAVLLTTYELIPALGVRDQVAATGRWARDNDLMKAAGYGPSDFDVTGTGSDINMEKLISLKPDLVISWTFRSAQIYFIEKQGIPVISIYPDGIDELYEVIRLHAGAFGKVKRGEECVSSMKSIFSLVKSRSAKIPASSKQRVLCLGSRPLCVSGSGGMNSDLIKITGGINCADEIGERNCDVPLERIIRWNPDVIFIWGNATYGPDYIINNPQWRHINAVKNRRVFWFPDWNTWSPRVAVVTLWMAMKIYPEIYSDVSFNSITDRFMRDVFGIPYKRMEQVE